MKQKHAVLCLKHALLLVKLHESTHAHVADIVKRSIHVHVAHRLHQYCLNGVMYICVWLGVCWVFSVSYKTPKNGEMSILSTLHMFYQQYVNNLPQGLTY